MFGRIALPRTVSSFLLAPILQMTFVVVVLFAYPPLQDPRIVEQETTAPNRNKNEHQPKLRLQKMDCVRSTKYYDIIHFVLFGFVSFRFFSSASFFVCDSKHEVYT